MPQTTTSNIHIHVHHVHSIVCLHMFILYCLLELMLAKAVLGLVCYVVRIGGSSFCLAPCEMSSEDVYTQPRVTINIFICHMLQLPSQIYYTISEGILLFIPLSLISLQVGRKAEWPHQLMTASLCRVVYCSLHTHTACIEHFNLLFHIFMLCAVL